MLYRFVFGDWSSDGHGITGTHIVDITSHTVEEMQANYKRNCERWGTTLDDIAHEYEDSSVDEDLYRRMKADGAKWECNAILGEHTFRGQTFYQEPYLTDDDAVDFAMDFIGCGIEDHTGRPLEWREVRDEAPILIGTWGAPIQPSFGYGMYQP